MTTQPTTDTTDTPKIKRRPYLNTRPLIDEEMLPFVGKVKRKAKNGKYQSKTHYWRVKKDANSIDGIQYGVDLMDMIKANQDERQAARLIGRILRDMGSLNTADFFCKHEFLGFIGAVLHYGANHCNYALYADKKMAEFLDWDINKPKPDESQATGGAE